MPRIAFDALPDDARLWVFASTDPLSGQEEARLLERVGTFLDGWKAHGAPLTCAADWRHGRFLLVGVDERSAPPSGCSIDAMVRVLKDLEPELGTSLLRHDPVWFRDDGGVRVEDRASFRDLARRGGVDGHTVVFDNTVTRLADVREGRWEVPAVRSWHSALLPGD